MTNLYVKDKIIVRIIAGIGSIKKSFFQISFKFIGFQSNLSQLRSRAQHPPNRLSVFIGSFYGIWSRDMWNAMTHFAGNEDASVYRSTVLSNFINPWM